MSEIYRVSIESRGITAMKVSEVNAVLRTAYVKVGEYWHANFRRSHFSNFAYGEYGYARRSRSYSRRKIKKLGHNLPLVFTGVSRDLSQVKTVRATKNSCHVTMPVAAFNFRSSPRAPDMRKEFTTVSMREHRLLDGRMERQLDRELSNHPARKVTKA